MYRYACEHDKVDDKSLRTIYDAIGSGATTHEAILAMRAIHISQAAYKTASGQAHLHARDTRARLGLPRMNYSAEDPASLAEPAPCFSQHAIGSLAPDSDPDMRLKEFLARRKRKDWARETRAANPESFAHDSLALSMLRRVREDLAPSCLDGLLFVACASFDPVGAKQALSWGADPLRPSPGENGPNQHAELNLLGALLSREAGALRKGGRARHTPSAQEDSKIHWSASLALACSPASSLSQMLSLGTGKSKAKAAKPNALGLSISLGQLHCARFFASLGMGLDDPHCLFEYGCWNELAPRAPLRAGAFQELYARLEARSVGLAMSTSERAPSPAKTRL
jgi:hypothetical protein